MGFLVSFPHPALLDPIPQFPAVRQGEFKPIIDPKATKITDGSDGLPLLILRVGGLWPDNSESLAGMLNENAAKVCASIVCPSTLWRTTYEFPTKQDTQDLPIPLTEVRGQVSLTFHIVLVNDGKPQFWRDEELDEDIRFSRPQLRAGNVLGQSGPFKFEVPELARGPLAATGSKSILKVVSDPHAKGFNIDLDSDAIVIAVQSRLHQQYELLKGLCPAVLGAVFAVPALSVAIEAVHRREADYSERPWLHRLRLMLHQSGIVLAADATAGHYLEYAQQLLTLETSLLDRAFEELSRLARTGEDDECISE